MSNCKVGEPKGDAFVKVKLTAEKIVEECARRVIKKYEKVFDELAKY